MTISDASLLGANADGILLVVRLEDQQQIQGADERHLVEVVQQDRSDAQLRGDRGAGARVSRERIEL